MLKLVHPVDPLSSVVVVPLSLVPPSLVVVEPSPDDDVSSATHVPLLALHESPVLHVPFVKQVPFSAP